MIYRLLFVYTLIIAAVITDYKYFKIPNILNLWGLITTIFLNMLLGVPDNLSSIIIGFLLPFFLLYFVFIVGGIGAGDIKLLCVIGGIIGMNSSMRFTIFCFLTSGILGIVKLLLLGIHKQKLFTMNKIHFSYAILAASILEPIINNIYYISEGEFF